MLHDNDCEKRICPGYRFQVPILSLGIMQTSDRNGPATSTSSLDTIVGRTNQLSITGRSRRVGDGILHAIAGRQRHVGDGCQHAIAGRHLRVGDGCPHAVADS